MIIYSDPLECLAYSSRDRCITSAEFFCQKYATNKQKDNMDTNNHNQEALIKNKSKH